MKTLNLFLITTTFFFTSTGLKAQEKETKVTDTASKNSGLTITTVDSGGKIFTAVEHEPEFKGGTQAFYKYLSSSVHYPADAVKNHVQGKVFIFFIVEKDGSLSNLKIVRSVSQDLDAESMRVIKDSPKWNPGTQNGKPVRVAYTMPISFTLSGR
jgi:protein TonB